MLNDQDYLTDAYAIRNANDRRAKARHAKGKKVQRDAKQLKLDRWLTKHGYTVSDIWSWLGRKGYFRGRGASPEVLRARGVRGAMIAAIKRRYCQHMKLAPKLRVGGKCAARFCCPSCSEPVSAEVLRTWAEKNREWAEKNHMEDLVV